MKEKDKVIGVLMPEKRFYSVSRAVMTEAAIDGGFTRDLYAALGEEVAKDTWTMRLYYKPFVRWIWSGGILMAIGALFCLFDPRYRRRKLQGKQHEPQSLLNSFYYFAGIAAVLLWQLMRNAEG